MAGSMTAQDLAGKRILITGAGGGIGRAIVIAALTRGAAVLAVDRDEKLLAETGELTSRQALAPPFVIAAADATDVDAVSEAVRQAEDVTGIPNVVVNTVGAVITKPVLECTVDELIHLMKINVGSILATSCAVVPRMEPGGSIVNIASSAATTIAPGLGLYGASKAAVIQLTRSLASELAPKDIRVNAVAPGMVDTTMPRLALAGAPDPESLLQEIVRQTHLIPRLARPEEIASGVLFLASGDAFTTGSTLYLDGGNSCR
jgi:NAD(P)-dependent dehydrogenase (short-subunit alcohol dehydrogenase family)